MALSVVKYPQGFILNTSSTIGTYTNGSTIISISSTDYTNISNYIYITSNQASGFWYVNKIASGQISISEYNGGSYYTFVGSGIFNYYFVGASHNWNSVHLPIVYKLQSTLWPTNSVDTVQTVSSYSNDNGYVKLTCSGALKSDITELEFVKVVFTGGTVGIYQVLSWYSNSIVTINLAYVGGLTFTSVQYYYNNYRAKVRIYAGLSSSHVWAGQKPMALISELSIIPDTSGIVTVNVSEDVKKQIDILKNDLLKGTLPNNIDAFCEFYITYAEAYDYSFGGYTLLDYVGGYADDSLVYVGRAVNADLPFKNIHSGYMSDYVNENNYYAKTNKFLTPTVYPEIVSGNYFDISYIVDETIALNTLSFIQELYLNSVLQSTVTNSLPTGIINQGVYRSGVTVVGNEDSQKVYLAQSNYLIAPTSWSNEGGSTSNFTFGASNFTYSSSTNRTFGAYQTINIDPASTVTSFNITFAYGGSATGPGFGGFPVMSFAWFLYSGDRQTGGKLIVGTGTIMSAFSQVINIDLTNSVGKSTRLYFESTVSAITSGTVNVTITFPSTPLLISTNALTEKKLITVTPSCSKFTNYNLCWLNYLGGFDYKVFQASSDYGLNIEGTKSISKNIFSNWPKSFGESGDTILQETNRVSRNTLTLRAETLTSDQVNDLYRIRQSPLVQIVNSVGDRRTVIPDASSFVYYKQREKLFTLEFTVQFTDNAPSQSL